MADKNKEEKFEYLFVDIEWNQPPGTTNLEEREPIQIGIVATDEEMNLKKAFSRGIRLSSPENCNPETLTLTHTTLNNVMQGNSEEEVLQRMNMTFPKYKYIVVWTNDTYELLKKGMDKYGLVMPRHRVIVFQQILMNIANNGVKRVGFEIALKRAGIEYQKNFLHYSKHDANYMYLLFCKCYEKYKQMTNQEICYLNKKTHIIHISNCRYIHNKENTTIKETTKDVIFQGNRVCKICGCEEEWNRLKWRISSGVKQRKSIEYLRKLPLTEENIRKICDKFNLEYKIAADSVFIRTIFSRWIIHIKNNEVSKLYHGNYRHRRGLAFKLHKKFIEEYHKQKLHSNIFYDVISYIKCHDEKMMKKMAGKSRIEMLFEMIERERMENV